MDLDTWAETVWTLLAVRPMTLRDYRNKYRYHVSASLGGKDVTQITRADIQALILSKPPATQKSILPIIKTLFREAISYGIRDDNPTRDVRKMPHITKRRSFMTMSQLQPLDFDAHTEMFLFMAKHGTRWSETVMIDQGDFVDTTNGRQIVISKSRDGATKSGKARTIPYMGGWNPDFPKNYSHARKRFAKVTEAALGEPYQIHSLRKTAAYNLKKAGVPAQVAQKILGHSTIELTMNLYTEVLPDEIEDAQTQLAAFFDALTD